MYILDTNIISELRKGKAGKANQNVIKWANSISASNLYISVITILELEMGILSKERKDPSQGAILRSWFNNHVIPAFAERILPIDTAIAQRCARLYVPNPCSDRDALIAATALVHGMTLVTKNTCDFEKTGLEIINPWHDYQDR
jgi:predicted nucleic acid-binding protein